MIFIVRSPGAAPPVGGVEVKLQRKTPEIVPGAAGKTDFFYLAEDAVMAALREQGWDIVPLRDGWYADDCGGGVAIWGQGRYWEMREDPFTVTQACGACGAPATGEKEGEHVEVRRAIFGV